MTDTNFNAYSSYYDLLYSDKDYVAEANYINLLLKRFNVPGNKLLEFGSGTGKHGRLLAGLGYTVTGVERSPEMVAQSEIIQGFNCQLGDIRTINLSHVYDAIVSLFHVISYQTSNESVISVFANAAKHLQVGGLFIFDVWYTPAVYAQRPEVRVKRMYDDTIEITRIAEPVVVHNDNRVDVNFSMFVRDKISNAVDTFAEIHPMRHFSLPELDLLAMITGFQIINSEEFLTGCMASQNTWGTCIIMKKIS